MANYNVGDKRRLVKAGHRKAQIKSTGIKINPFAKKFCKKVICALKWYLSIKKEYTLPTKCAIKTVSKQIIT